MRTSWISVALVWVGLASLSWGQAAPQAQPPAQPPPSPPTGALNLQNASLKEVIDALCRQLRINYILDPRVEGGVILNTYGETRNIDTRSLLDLILRINGAAMVQVGEFYRIVPLAEASRLPIPPQVNATDFPADDQIMLNLIFLKYVTVEEIAKLLEPFLGEGSKTWAYPPANLLLILDSRRNMKRLMELVSLFDSDTLASQRVRLFEVSNGRPSDLAKELDTVLKSISLNEKVSSVRFLPIDRINMIIAVASNPGVFDKIEEWLKKLDVPVKVTAGTIDNYTYRVKYGRAEILAMAIMQLYGGFPGFGFGGFGGFGGGFGGYGGFGGGGFPGGGFPGGGMYGQGGYPGGQFGGYGGFGGGGYGQFGGGYGPGFTPSYNTAPGVFNAPIPQAGAAAGQPGVVQSPLPGQQDLTGSYLGAGQFGAMGRIPRVVPNPMDNTLLIQGTPQEYEQILKLLRDLDIAPRQVLIDAKIYEVSLTGAFASGVAAFLQRRGATPGGGQSLSTRALTGSLESGALNLSVGALVGQSRELLAFLSAEENTTRAKVISAPSIIATDSIAASINVGTEVPTLSAQAVAPIQSGGSSLFTNTIQNRNTGVTLNIVARVNPSGVVTLIINQEVSAPQAPAAGSIQSPSFSKRTIQTQVTLQDGDTIAIGGIINETESSASAGIPVLHRIPILGAAFGSKSLSKERTELVVFMTPRVIYDVHELLEATDELKSRFRRLNKMIQE